LNVSEAAQYGDSGFVYSADAAGEAEVDAEADFVYSADFV